MQVKKQQLELDMKQQTGSKSGQGYIKALFCHPGYLTSMQSTHLEWNAEVARFIADFPALTVPSNGPIFQEKLDLLYSPNKTTKQKLEAAYMAAIADPNWQPAAPVDRVAENANWDKDASTFEKAHPQMFVGANETVLQEYVNALSRPGLTNNQLLELSYRAALADRRWTNKR